jgi:hypothetical protein
MHDQIPPYSCYPYFGVHLLYSQIISTACQSADKFTGKPVNTEKTILKYDNGKVTVGKT